MPQWDGIQQSMFARHVLQILIMTKAPRVVWVALLRILFGTEPTVLVAQKTLILIWSHSNAFLVQEIWFLTRSLWGVFAHQTPLTFQAINYVLVATGPGTGTWIPKHAINVLMVLITIKISKFVHHVLQIYPFGMDQLVLGARQMNTLIKGQGDVCLAQVAWPLTSILWNVNAHKIYLTFQSVDAFHVTLQIIGMSTPNNA